MSKRLVSLFLLPLIFRAIPSKLCWELGSHLEPVSDGRGIEEFCGSEPAASVSKNKISFSLGVSPGWPDHHLLFMEQFGQIPPFVPGSKALLPPSSHMEGMHWVSLQQHGAPSLLKIILGFGLPGLFRAGQLVGMDPGMNGLPQCPGEPKARRGRIAESPYSRCSFSSH